MKIIELKISFPFLMYDNIYLCPFNFNDNALGKGHNVIFPTENNGRNQHPLKNND